jgi:phosphatidylglycerol---prolipoprotein diacylglyceryl transferase
VTVPDPILVSVGPFDVRWYGLLIVIGAILGALVARAQAKANGDEYDHVWNMLAVCLVLGIIGARLYHVFSSPAGGALGWPHYRQHPIDIIAFWKGGLQGFGIYGAVIGGILGVWSYARLARLSFVRWLDYAVVGLILAQAIGRWGNYFNQELYGPPTDLPWAIYIDPAHRLRGLEGYDTFHPVFLYESFANLAIGAFLFWISRRRRQWLLDGDIFLMYLVLYPFVRFWLEYLRPDAWMVGTGLAAAQLVSLICMVGAGLALFLRHRSAGPSGASDGGEITG